MRTREWFEAPYRLGAKQVSGRFVYHNSAGNINIYVASAQFEPSASFKDRDNDRSSIVIKARHRAARHLESCRRNKGLNFDQERSCSFKCGSNDGPRGARRPLAQENFGRVRDLN